MKKIMTICFFAFAMVLVTQTSMAQSVIEVNAAASQKAKELKQVIKFNDDKHELVYQAYQEYELAKFNVDQMIAAGKTVPEKDRMELNNMLAEKFKTLFTAEQYERYLNLFKKSEVNV